MVAVLFLFLDILSLIRFGTWVHAYSLFAMFRLKATTRGSFFLTQRIQREAEPRFFPHTLRVRFWGGTVPRLPAFSVVRVTSEWCKRRGKRKLRCHFGGRQAIHHAFVLFPFRLTSSDMQTYSKWRESGSFLNSLKVIHCSVGSPPFSSFCFHTIRKPEGNQFTLY